MVGNEGMAGMPFILGMGVSGVRALVQGSGSAWRMKSSRFRIEFNRIPPRTACPVPLHPCVNGADFANGCMQPLSRSRSSTGPLVADDPRPRRIGRVFTDT